MARLLALVGILSAIACVTDSPQLRRALLTVLALAFVRHHRPALGYYDTHLPSR